MESQPQPPSAAEDEALKKNTDCVYFLASPLTCKKGSGCEYRHSDSARVNPRDCWFWLNSNCLNPKCSFRHPPLDGLLGTQMPMPTGPSPPALQTVAMASTHVLSAPNKQAVPCVYFQKGYCMKGDWCPFLHGPNSMSNKAPLVPAAVPATEPTFKVFGGVNKLTQVKVPPTTDVAKPLKVTLPVKSSMEVERTLPRMGFSVNKRTPQTSVHELPEYRNVASAGNGSPRVQQPRLLDEFESMNNKDAEEVSREPSPGFDVLVDDEGRDPGYYPGEGQYGMSNVHEIHNEYDISHSSDYSTIADIANERYQDHPLPYGSHERFKDHQYPREHGASSERISGGSSSLERRPYARVDNRGQVDELDLRHRLAKHKKANGLRSVISHEHSSDRRHAEDRSYQGFRRDEKHLSRHENSLSSRLRGRIRLPGRSLSPADRDRDMVRAGDHGRLSPVRPIPSSTQGRIRDRIKKGGAEEDFSDGGGKNHRGMHSRRDLIMNDTSDFAGPKSLSELKNKKNGELSGHNVTDQQSLGKRKHLMLDCHINRSGGDGTSFDGPKPLQEILKRKRGGETIGSASGGNSSTNEDNKQNEVDKSASAEKTDTERSKVQAEDGILVEDGEHQDYEAFGQRDNGDYDYEREGGEEFELYDGGENGEIEGEEEYPDEEDDDDDFAKKMGVVYSV